MQDDKQFIQAYSVAKWSISDYFRRSIYVDRGIASFLEDLNQPFIYIGKDTIKLQDELQGEVIAQLPNASVMYQLIDKPSDVHTFTPKYHKLAEAERNWINSQKNN